MLRLDLSVIYLLIFLQIISATEIRDAKEINIVIMFKKHKRSPLCVQKTLPTGMVTYRETWNN